MPDTPDTSPDAVRALVDDLKHAMPESMAEVRGKAHRTLSALLARCEQAESERAGMALRACHAESDALALSNERDALLARCEHLESEAEEDAANIKRLHELNATFVGIEAERDDLRARLDESRKMVSESRKMVSAASLTIAKQDGQLTAAQARIVELEEAVTLNRNNWLTDSNEKERALSKAQARMAELEERLHYCNGTSELALKHRDEAEVREKMLREAAASVIAYFKCLKSTEESRFVVGKLEDALAGSAQPSAGVRNYQVLVFEPQIHRSVWQDYGSEEPMSEDEIVESMRAGVESGNYVGWRVLTLHKEVIGRDAVALARFKAAQPSAPEGGKGGQ